MYEDLNQNIPSPSKIWFKMRKNLKENTRPMGPQPLSEHYNTLNKDLKW